MHGATRRGAAEADHAAILDLRAARLTVPQARPKKPGDRIALIGLRGCGKTTVGRLLAQALGWDFVDTDVLVATAAGQSIAEIFASAGEAAFRALEARAVERALARCPCIISIGGGAVVLPANRELLQRSAYCIWLTADPEELHRRIDADPASQHSRPTLTRAPAAEEMRQLLAERRPLYEALARQVVGTGGRTPNDVAKEILTRLRHRPEATEGQCRSN
jgi:shikimate kinase